MVDFFKNLTFCCWWDVPVLIFLLGMTAWFLVKRFKLKREKEELQNQLSK